MNRRSAPTNSQRCADLSVQQLRTFRHVYEQGGYAGAARTTGLSVPTVWQHIQTLEKLYDVKLFKKVGRRVSATSAADQLYGVITEIIAGLESTFELVRDANESCNSITLVTGVRMMLEDLAKPLRQFQRSHSTTLLIRHGNNRRAEELILSGEADIALTLDAGYQRESQSIHYEPAYYVDFLAVGPKSHPFFAADRTSLRELVKYDLVVSAPGTHGRDALDQALHQEHLKASIPVETDNSGFTIACVQAGMGLGILAGRPDGQLCRRLAVRSLRRQLGRRQIVFMWKKGRRLTLPLLDLIDEVRNYHLNGQQGER